MYKVVIEKFYQKVVEIPDEEAKDSSEAEDIVYEMWADGKIKFTEDDFAETICECIEEVHHWKI